MCREHDSLDPKQNHESNLCDSTFSIKEVLAMHMHKEHNDAAPVQKSHNICYFTSYMSRVLKNHIDMKHQGILKTFECNNWDFFANSKGVLKYHEHVTHKKNYPKM